MGIRLETESLVALNRYPNEHRFFRITLHRSALPQEFAISINAEDDFTIIKDFIVKTHVGI